MVVKIMEAAGSMSSPLEYNERKVASGEASLLEFWNMDAPPGYDGIRSTFERYEHLNIRSRDVSFHMTINPSEGETMTPDAVKRLTLALMEDLGYLGQPIAVYEHHDIDRTHWHVLSIRTNEQGKKIRDFQEQRRCQESLQRHAREFGYQVGNGTAERMAQQDIDISRFDPKRGHSVAQMDAIFRECLKYHFTTVTQFQMILEHHGIHADAVTADNTHFVLQGLNSKDRPCTRKVDEAAIGLDLYRMYEERAMECYSNRHNPRREMSKVSSIGSVCLHFSKSEEHFLNMMKRKDIDVAIYRNPKTGAVTGANYVDHMTRHAFRGEELGSGLTTAMYNAAESSGQWSAGDSSDKAENRAESSGPTVGDLLAGLSSGNGKSKEKDLKDRKRRKRGVRI